VTGAGWSSDPSGAHELRYWDGEQWTDHVSDGGAMTRAPLGLASSTVEPAAPPPTRNTSPGSGRQLLGMFKNRWIILLALCFVGIPVAVGIAVAVTHDSSSANVEPFENTDAACEAWWQANVSAARDGWDDAKLRREVGRIAEATEPVDAQLSQYLRAITLNSDPGVIRDNIEMTYQRCVLLQWRGATDAELAIIGSPTAPTR
jgi:hypothetical protein